MNAQANSRPGHSPTPGGRQPLLWAALAFAAGLAIGVHAWRPPLWWVVAWIVFALSGAYLLRRRGRAAFIVGLGALFFLGALMIQVRSPDDAGNSGWLRLADGTEVIVTAHVTREGTPQEDGGIRQRLEVETEQIAWGNQTFASHAGLRLNVYEQQSQGESGQEAGAATVRVFRYGERLRFPARVFPPRNYRKPRRV